MAFYDDTVKFGAGTYKIVGYGLSAMLIRAGILEDRDGSYPFALIALLTWLPLTAWLCVQAHRARELWVPAAAFSISILVLLFIGPHVQQLLPRVADDRRDGGGAGVRGGAAIATFVLIHGAGDTSWYWHLVVPELRERGHDAVAVDLPCDDDSAGLVEYADAVVDAIGDRTELVVVAQSLGGFTAGLVCDRLPVDLVVLVAGMVPAPGETFWEWGKNTGYEGADLEGDPIEVFMHDVPPDLAAEAMRRGRDQSGTPLEQPWPLDAWPDVPTRYLLCTEDRMFPPYFTRRMVRDRLGITPDEIESSHCPALSRPRELAERLVTYASERPSSS